MTRTRIGAGWLGKSKKLCLNGSVHAPTTPSGVRKYITTLFSPAFKVRTVYIVQFR